MTIAAIQSLLNAKLATFAAAQSPALTVAYENKDYTPATPAKLYLRCFLLPATPRAAGLGTTAQDYIRGIYQIDVMGLPNTGWAAALEVADKLRTHFKRGTMLTSSGTFAGTELVCESVAVAPAMAEDTRYKIPVSITFYAYMTAA